MSLFRYGIGLLHQRMHETFMLVTDKFYRTKYRAVSQQLGLEENEPRLGRGFVVVQID